MYSLVVLRLRGHRWLRLRLLRLVRVRLSSDLVVHRAPVVCAGTVSLLDSLHSRLLGARVSLIHRLPSTVAVVAARAPGTSTGRRARHAVAPEDPVARAARTLVLGSAAATGVSWQRELRGRRLTCCLGQRSCLPAAVLAPGCGGSCAPPRRAASAVGPPTRQAQHAAAAAASALHALWHQLRSKRQQRNGSGAAQGSMCAGAREHMASPPEAATRRRPSTRLCVHSLPGARSARVRSSR